MKPLSVATAPSVPWAGAVEALTVRGSPSASSQKTVTFSGLPVRIVMLVVEHVAHGGRVGHVTVTVAGADWVTRVVRAVAERVGAREAGVGRVDDAAEAVESAVPWSGVPTV